MKPGDLRPVFFDPIHFKLLAERKNGRYDLVDVNSLSKTLSASSEGYLLKPHEDTEKFIDIDTAADTHYLFHIADDNLQDYGAEINSTYTITNIGEGMLELVPLDVYANKVSIQTAFGPGIGAGGACVLRYLGNNKWHANGDNGFTYNKRYDLTVETVLATPNSYLRYGLAEKPSGSVVITPTIQLKKYQELELHINASGHPVVIQPNQTTGTYSTYQGAAISHDFSQSGVESGVLKFRPYNTGTWYYNCQYHANMGGAIVVS